MAWVPSNCLYDPIEAEFIQMDVLDGQKREPTDFERAEIIRRIREREPAIIARSVR